jgi:hypothetical protein
VVTMGSSGAPAASSGGGKSHHCLGETAFAGGSPMGILILGALLGAISLRRR